MGSRFQAHVVRLRPDEELKSGIIQFAKERGIRAGTIVSCVGSLKQARIRLAAATSETAANEIVSLDGKYEIVSLVGTLSDSGKCHLHISLADEAGNVVGGHVVDSHTVFTTAEIVIADCTDLVFAREMDAETGFKELVVKRRSPL